VYPGLKSGASEEMPGAGREEEGFWGPVGKMRRDLLAKVRRGQLEREARRYPLLAERMIEEELRKRPRYYAGEG
jgi:hypothetical protein